MAPAPEPLGEEQLLEREQAGYQRGREEAVAEYEAQINNLRAELEQKTPPICRACLARLRPK